MYTLPRETSEEERKKNKNVHSRLANRRVLYSICEKRRLEKIDNIDKIEDDDGKLQRQNAKSDAECVPVKSRLP